MNKVVKLGKLLRDSRVTDGIKSLAEIQGNNSNIAVGSKERLLTYDVQCYCPQILPYTQEIRGKKNSKNRSRQWSSRGQNCTKLICAGLGLGLHWGSLQSSPDPIASGRGLAAPAKEPTPPRPLCY